VLLGPSLAGRVAFAVEQGKHDAARAELAELSGHDQLSKLFRAVTKAVKPAVVEVRVVRRVRQPERPHFFRDEDFPLPFRFRFNVPQNRPRYFQQRGLGSGVIIDAENGYVLTNYHVIGEADGVEIVLSDGRKFDAEWARFDRQSDIAVVKIAPENLIAAPLGDSEAAEVGDWVLAIGAPRGLPQTVTAGIISAKGRVTMGGLNRFEDSIQTDAAINKGNSGGPLVNMRGEVIGLNNYIISYSGGNEGIGFAIPSNMAKEVVEQLIDTGQVVRGYLGVLITPVDPRVVESLGLPDSQGAWVATVEPDSPADKAGLKIEDVIVSVNEKKVTSPNEVKNLVATIPPGTTVPVEIYRNGQKMTLPVTTIERPKPLADRYGRRSEPSDSGAGRFGIRVVTMTEDLAARFSYQEPLPGVVIVEVAELSDAAEQGLAAGMVITHVQGLRVETVERFAEIATSEAAAAGLRLRVVDPSGLARLVFVKPHKTKER